MRPAVLQSHVGVILSHFCAFRHVKITMRQHCDIDNIQPRYPDCMLEPGNTRYVYAGRLYICIEFRFEISKFQVITLKTVRTLIGITTPSTLCSKKRAPFLFTRLLRVFLTNIWQYCSKFYIDAQYLIVTQAENTPSTTTVDINIRQQNPTLKLLTTQFEMNTKHSKR